MPIKPSQVGNIRDLRMDNAANAVVPLKTREEYAREISQLWLEAEEKFLTIGQYLVQAKNTLPHGEYEAMVRHDLQMSVGTSRKLRTVAEAIEGKRLPADKLPPNYSTIYIIATLPDDLRYQAEAEGLIRQDVRRSELDEFKKRHRPEQGRGGDPHEALRAERDRLLARLREIDEKLSEKMIDITPVHVDEA